MGEGDLAQGLAIQPAPLRSRLARRGQTVVEAPGQGTGFAVAGAFRVFAGLVAGHQLQYAQGGCADLAQSVESQLAARCLGGKEEHLVQGLALEGLEQREEGAEGLADAGGRLGHQAAAGAHGLVHGFGELALAVAESGMGKGQGFQRGIACAGMGQLLFGPGDEALALLLEEGSQVAGPVALGEQGFLLAADIEIDQRQFDLRQRLLLAEQPAVDLELCPMQLPVVGRHALEVAAVGLHFLQAALRRVVAIGATAYPQRTELAAEGQLGLVALATAAGHQDMAGHAFLGGGCGREAQVEVAAFRGEFAECTHGYAVGHGQVCAHCT
ncbi:hypothetical protein FQZ97_654350 [compost metagenome]